MAGVKKSAIKAEIAKKFKIQNQEERIAVFGLKARFGGGRSSGFVTVYDDADARNKYDTKVNKYRDGIVARPKLQSRKLRKDVKSKRLRVKGTAKSKVQAGKKGGKK